MAGSTPMLTEMGRGRPSCSARSAMGTDVPGPGGKEDGQLIPALNTQTMDGDIVYPGVRMGGVAHSQRDVGPGVIPVYWWGQGPGL